jgi:translocation and assembly module TamA
VAALLAAASFSVVVPGACPAPGGQVVGVLACGGVAMAGELAGVVEAPRDVPGAERAATTHQPPAEEAGRRRRGGIREFIDRLREPAVAPQDAPVEGRKPRYVLEFDAPPALERLVRDYTLLGRWRFREDYDPSQLPLFIRRAPEEIEALLAAEGFFEPKVEVEPVKNGARVIIVAGPRTTVNLADVGFTGPITDPSHTRLRERIRDAWLLPEGSFFQSNAWERAKRELVESAANAGFLRARLGDSEALVNLEATAVSLRVELESGPRFDFGDVRVSGLKRYPEQVVLGLRTFRHGQPFRQNDIVEFQTRLNGSGYFTAVNVRPDVEALEDDESLGAVPIRVEVVEAQAKRLSLGGGYDTDRGLNVLLGWENKNLLDSGLRSNSGLELDLQRQLVYSTIDTPYDNTGWRWQFGARAQHNDVRNDVVDAASLFLSRARLYADTEAAVSVQLQYEQQNIGLSPTESLDLRSQATVLGYSWTRRRLDSPVFPTRGYQLAAQLSGASQDVLSRRSFFRMYGSGLRIFTLPEGTFFADGRLLLRGEAGAVLAEAREGIPSQNLFRTGGVRSVRGYGSQALGVPVGQAVVGGRFLLVASAEYQYPLWENLYLATFFDRGNAMDSVSNFRTVAGYGAGLRWRTPVGPLNLDLAYGEADRQVRFHLSLGVVF